VRCRVEVARTVDHIDLRKRGRMLYMIVEYFRAGDAVPVYRRLRDQGRMAPEGLRYLASWVTDDLRRCFQVMECDDPALLRQWTECWADLVDGQRPTKGNEPEMAPHRRRDPAWPDVNLLPLDATGLISVGRRAISGGQPDVSIRGPPRGPEPP
jgi:hypothetical protein